MTHRSWQSVFAGRGFMLFPAAAFAVHQLRYELVYGDRTGQALTAQGHGYLNSLAPWAVLLVALGLGSFLARVARVAGGRPDAAPRRDFAGLWLLAWACLLSTYALQEWLEGTFVAGHPSGLAGVFGHGGWWAVVLSALAALVVAALLRAASAVVDVVSRLVAGRPALLGALFAIRPSRAVLPRRAPLAGKAAGRAPPGTRIAAA
jgi:hypothetical protein